eukprot:CAMPEP_0185003938 /NCGR_PEP_ID=MMETSP1098-20130426/77905_1 /TAXON_ID=89044 /ORGANISM="Spumella elongata, Strain CCAP 955/1" /LENGTH=39 /DNA_ID= /DNA_START= /DNA_END= /DNA_ORIENTATION=
MPIGGVERCQGPPRRKEEAQMSISRLAGLVLLHRGLWPH